MSSVVVLELGCRGGLSKARCIVTICPTSGFYVPLVSAVGLGRLTR